MTARVLVTGAGGFIGRELVPTLRSAGMLVRPATRGAANDPEAVRVREIGPATDWSSALEGVDAVVHLANVAHGRGSGANAFVVVNEQGTIRLAEQAASAGIRRFVYLSSIAIHGHDADEKAITESTPPAPRTPYGLSKWRAEEALRGLGTSMEVVFVRPPMVYGPDAPANFGRLLRAVRSGLPLPFSGTTNRRSMIGRANLTHFIRAALTHPRAAGQAFVVADDDAVSTERLVQLIAEGLDRPARLFPVPERILGTLRRTGVRSLDKLFGSLVVDAGYARRVLDWRPPVSIDAGVRDAARASRPVDRTP